MNAAIAVPTDVYNAVAPIAKQYNVPDAVWETVAYQESSFDPKAVGDNGSSFGLFQLHEGGQLPQQYYSDPQAVFSPSLNAQLAMPAIARGYQQAGAIQADNLAWWEKFGAISGHPGYPIGGKDNAAEAKGLLAKYPSFSSGNQSSGGGPNSNDCCNGDFWCQVWVDMVGVVGCPNVTQAAEQGAQQDVQAAIGNAVMAGFQAVFNQLKPAIFKAGIFILGLVLFILAWWILLHPQEVSNA